MRYAQLDRLVTALGLLPSEVAVLIRAERVLHRWAELECGDGDNYTSWSIERDETTNKPYHCVYPRTGASYRTPIADREASTLKRIQALCNKHALHFYHQTDPRGCALYVAREPLTDQNYTRGNAVCG